jgi:hypothetical protein
MSVSHIATLIFAPFILAALLSKLWLAVCKVPINVPFLPYHYQFNPSKYREMYNIQYPLQHGIFPPPCVTGFAFARASTDPNRIMMSQTN